MKKLTRSYAVLAYQTILLAFGYLQRRCTPSLACTLQNLFVALHGSKIKYRYDHKEGLYIATEGDLIRFFGDMGRGFGFYARSIKTRGNDLADSYCLKNIKFNSDDVVIDCGANYGDLYLYLRDKIKESNYIAIEPGPVEYKCLLKSLSCAQIVNFGLSNSDGELDFYLCSESGDSSLIEPKNYTQVVRVKVKTIDSLVKDLGISGCRLFKLEAEGWEPEILAGAHKFITSCDYVAVDGGLERGVDAEATFPAVNNFLMSNGFEMVDIFGPSYRALYKNCYAPEN